MPYYGDFYWYCENFVNRSRKPRIERKFSNFVSGDRIQLKNLEIEPFEVDHSIYGAYGFLIHTSEGIIAYTGDLRLHGPRSKLTEEFIKKMTETNPEVIISEGTRIEEKQSGPSETDVYSGLVNLVANTKNLVVANFAPRDLDRLKTFLEASKSVNRKLVVSLKQAYLLKSLELYARELALPLVQDESLSVYIHRSSWGVFNSRDYYKWQREFLNYENAVTFKDVRTKQNEYVFFCDYFSLHELNDIQPSKGSRYVYSLSEPHDEEQQIDYERMLNWLNHFNLGIDILHSSGHLCCSDLQKMIGLVKPTILIPIHTNKPQLCKNILNEHSNVVLPEIGKPIVL